MEFIDRVSAYPNRHLLIEADGSQRYVVLERADEPVTVGTPLNAETFNPIVRDVEKSKTLVVTLDEYDVPSHSATEIFAHVQNGGHAVLWHEPLDNFYTLTYCSSYSAAFTIDYIEESIFEQYVIYDDKSVDFFSFAYATHDYVSMVTPIQAVFRDDVDHGYVCVNYTCAELRDALQSTSRCITAKMLSEKNDLEVYQRVHPCYVYSDDGGRSVTIQSAISSDNYRHIFDDENYYRNGDASDKRRYNEMWLDR